LRFGGGSNRNQGAGRDSEAATNRDKKTVVFAKEGMKFGKLQMIDLGDTFKQGCVKFNGVFPLHPTIPSTLTPLYSFFILATTSHLFLSYIQSIFLLSF